MPSISPPAGTVGRKTLAVLRDIAVLASAEGERGEVLDRILERLREGLGCASATLYRAQAGEAPAVLAHAGACDRPAAGGPEIARVAHTAQAVVVAEGEAFREQDYPSAGRARTRGAAQVLVPVRAPSGVLGVLEGRWVRARPTMLAAAPGVLATVAGHVGLVLRTRELLEGNLGKIQQILALQRVSRQMTSGAELGGLLRMVVQEALRLTEADGGALYLLEGADPGHLSLAAWAGEPPPPGRERVPLGYGIVGWVARGGGPLRVSDRGAGREGTAYASRRSQLAVPLVSDARVLGVLAVEGSREESFSPNHEELLGLFAAQAAKAIEARRYLQEIREERDLREQILDGTPNGVIAVDSQRRVILMNGAARSFLGIEEAPEGNPLERYLMSPPFLERVNRVLGGEDSSETCEIGPEGRLEARCLLASVFALGPRPRGATVILQDFTEHRRLDERVQRMSRLASLGQLAAGIAHEIRNPLTGVGISLDILREEPGLSGDGRALLDDINREIDRLETLIRGILDFARPQPPQFRVMRVAKALEWHRTFEEQCRKRSIRFRCDLRGNPKVRGDPEKLKQLFLNLAINALDAVPAGGEIRVWTDRVGGKPHPWARVSVEDSGSGMDEETLAQVFNPFYTTKNEGTGLGLSIAHSIVEQHRGRIDVQSRPGRGSRFIVDLPALEDT
ncbi:MAG: GAF domain-containing protein [Deferrisomatales bacterium]|nr:GAF domain-containing protein [Deferrisomatales bacterium]